MIECTTLYQKKKKLPKERLRFRLSSYAVIVKDEKVLLLELRSTGKYFLPGGGVELGEKIEDALAREVGEEVGIEVDIIKFLGFKESFFYYDPWDEAYQNISFFYLCEAKTFDLLDNNKILDEEVINPRWISIRSLKEDNFQVFGREIIEFLKVK